MRSFDKTGLKKDDIFLSRSATGLPLQVKVLEDISQEAITLALDISKHSAWIFGANYAMVLAAQGKVEITPITFTETWFSDGPVSEVTQSFDSDALAGIIEATKQCLPAEIRAA